jgi:hypothetical protein
MKAAGLDPAMLDRGPSTVVFVGKAEASDKPAPPKKQLVKRPPPRRKKIHWQTVPLARLKRRSQCIWAAATLSHPVGGLKNRTPHGDAISCEGDQVSQDGSEVVFASELKLDNKALEALFVEQQQNTNSMSSSVRRISSAKSFGSSSVSLLDGRRAQNVAISLKRIKLSHSAIRDGLTALDLSALGEDTVKLLDKSQLLPTRDEVQLVEGYEGDVGELGVPERFFRVMAQVQHAPQLLRTLVYMSAFDEHSTEVRGAAAALAGACR